MTTQHTIDFGYDQNVGLSGRAIQSDAVQVDLIRPNLLVAAIADGNGNDRPGKVAISRLWRVLKGNNGNEGISSLLAKAMQEANQALLQENQQNQSRLQAGLTVVVVQNNQLYLAHIGTGRAYLVRGQQVSQLTDDQPKQALGLEATLQPQLRPTNLPDNRLKAGDRIVLSSDGLGRLRPGGQTPFLEPKEMPAVVNNPNVPALEAARTLVSLAVGRKADDNVSVVVLGLPRPGLSPLWFVGLGLLAIGLLAIGGLAIIKSRPTPTPTPTLAPPTLTPTPAPIDNGTLFVRAVTGRVWQQTSDGQSLELSRGDSIPVGDTILAEADSQISLSLADGSFVYLPAGGQIRFAQLDLETEPNKTVLVLLSGRVLLERPATSTEQLLVVDTAGNTFVQMDEAGIAAVTGDGFVACLSGRCGELAAGQQQQNNQPPQTIDPALQEEWQTICNCLP